MSFSSLLSKISTDKNIKEKTKNVAASISSSNKSAQSSSVTVSKGKNLKTQPQKPKGTFNRSYADDDPAVRRLKEARRKERERLDALNGKSSSQSKRTSSQSTRQPSSRPSSIPRKSSNTDASSLPKKASSVPPPPKSRFKFKPSKHNISLTSTTKSSSNGETNKLSFKELMEQASTIKKPSSSSIPFTSPQKQKPKGPSEALQSIHRARTRELSPTIKYETKPKSISRPEQIPQSKFIRKPQFATPNTDLLKKLHKKKQNKSLSRSSALSSNHNRTKFSSNINRRANNDSYDIDAQDEDEDEYDTYGYEDEYDSQDDGFIVDEDDEIDDHYLARERASEKRTYNDMKSKGYSKDEIWEIFSRGKKRSYYNQYDDDSDDMEATGNEILEDEERTLKQARLDDLREQKLLEQKALQKGKLFKK